MSNYANLKSAIQSVIKTNENNEITGQLLQTELLAMITTLGYGYQFMGIASPDTVPGTPDAKVFYIAYAPGTYTNFGGIAVTGLCVLKYATGWVKEDIPVSGGGGTDFTVDPTDLTLVSGTPNKLKFADRLRESNITTGKNYIILRETGTFAQQVTTANCVYEIRYDFSLSENFTLPDNCVLYFNGGKISGAYNLIGSDTTLMGNVSLDGITLTGTFTNQYCFLSWWGCSSQTGVDNSDKIELALNSTIRNIYVNGKFGISKPVNISKGTHFILGSSIGGFKNNGFIANDDFSTINVTLRDEQTYVVSGMFYHSFDQAANISNIFLDAKWKAKYGIEHIAGYSSPYLENLYIQHAKVAGILQYACEKPIWKHVYISECVVGFYISPDRIDESDVLLTNGTRVGSPNLVTLYDCRAISCNYGMIINGGSNTSLDNCETAYNAIAGVVGAGSMFFNNFYSEGDAKCAFFWNNDGTKSQNSSGDGYTPEDVVAANKDGFLISTNTLLYDGSVYFRAPVVMRGGNISVSNSFISLKPRSFQLNDVTTVEYPTERTAAGVDCVFLLININDARIYGDNIIYRHSNDSGKYPNHLIVFGNTAATRPYPNIEYDYGKISYAKDPIFCAFNASIGSFSPYNTIGNPTFNLFPKRVLSSHTPKSYCQLTELAKYGALASNTKFDFRTNKFIEIYDGVPLYKRDTAISNYNGFYFTKAQLAELFPGEDEIKIRVLMHNPTQQSFRAVIQATFYNASYANIKSYASESSAAATIDPGFFELIYIVPVNFLGDDTWDKVRYSLSITNESTGDIYVSDLLMYGVSAKMVPPVMSSYLLQSGTTAKRPNANAGQLYYDTTLGKMIMFNGTDWVNVDGTALVQTT